MLSPDCRQPTLLPCLCPKQRLVGTFLPNFQQQSCFWRHYQLKLQYTVIRPTSTLHNRVVSFGLALLGAVHEHPKNRNNFCAQVHFLALSIQAHAEILHLMKNLTGNLTNNFHTNFWVAIFPFFRSGITPACGGLTLRQRFPYILGTTSGFYLTQRKKG